MPPSNQFNSASRRRQIESGKKNKSEYIEQRCGHVCQICGEKFCSDVLEFHHIDPSEKGPNGLEWRGINQIPDKTLNEAKKCAIICPTCHAFEHIALKRGETLINDYEAYLRYRNHRFSGDGSVDGGDKGLNDSKEKGIPTSFPPLW